MIGKRLRELREERKLGVRELARKAGVAPSVVSTAENGKYEPSLKNARKLARALGVGLGELAEGEEG